jgi:transcriptional regulator with XRE-family HTH domain
VNRLGRLLVEEEEAEPVLARLTLGLRLRGHRTECGLTLDEAAGAIGVEAAQLQSLEGGHTAVVLRNVIDLCDVYGVRDHAERTTLLGLGREANTAGWWAAYGEAVPPWQELYLGLEQTARLIRPFEVQFVNALLQTADYARHQIAQTGFDLKPDEVEARVELRMRRQRVLHGDNPPHLWIVADEASLRRPVGGRAVMFRQLELLSDLCDLPRVTLQVIPFAGGGYAAASGAFTMLRLPGTLPDVVYWEQLTTAVYFDTPDSVDRYRDALNFMAARDADPAARTQSILRRFIREG